jgi:Mrp family chromosome partitioning ATPase
MSVLDRAIVKAFERRSLSAKAEKPAVMALPQPARTTAAIAATTSTRSAESAAPAIPPATRIQPENVASAPQVIDAPQTVTEVATVQSAETAAQEEVMPRFPATTDRIAVPPPIPVARHEAQITTEPNLTILKSAPATSASETPQSPLPRPAIASPISAESHAQESLSARSKSVVVHQTTTAEPPPVPRVSTSLPQQTWQWPEICEQLDQFTGEGFQQLAKHLQFAAEQGHKVLAFVSSQRDAGRTSVLLTLTRILALEGKSSVLLIDADHRHPNIATLSGLQQTIGFEDVLQGSSRVPQAITPMTPGRVTVLPLLKPVAEGDWRNRVTAFRVLLHQARRDYDMVLIDAGVFGAETKMTDCWLRGIADAVVTVSRQLTVQSGEHVVLDWKQIGIESLGVIETFA